MKPFTAFLMELNRPYDFTVRLAGCDINEDMKARFESALSMFKVQNVGAFKRLPIQEHADFPGLGPCEVHVVEVSLAYPTISPQLSKLIAERLNIPARSVLVRTKLEEAQHEPAQPQPVAKDGSLLNNPELTSESAQELVGQARTESMLKQLQTRKYEFAEQGEKPKAMDTSVSTKSPVGSNQNTIPNPRKGK